MALTFTSLSLLCVICYGLYWIITWHVKRRRLYELASKFPGPPVLPIVGNALMLIGSSEHRMNKIIELSESYPLPCRMWIGPHLFVIFSDPEHFKELCLNPKTMGKGAEIEEFGRPFFGTGLFTAPVSIWRAHRKLIQPTFNTKILEPFVEIFLAQSNILNERFEKNLDGPEFEIFKMVHACHVDMISETALGVKIGSQTNKNCQYVEALQHVVQSFCKRFFSPWLHPDFIFNLTKVARDQKKHLQVLVDLTNNVIQTKKNELLKPNSQPNTADKKSGVGNSRHREVFLDQLIKANIADGNLSDESLRYEVHTMLLIGTDTSAITLCYTLLLLASHPEIQDKVYEELCEIYGRGNREDLLPLTAKDLPRMKYLERVIKESMRLLPMSPMLPRGISEEVKIGDHILPKGCTALIAMMSLQRDAKYFPDPLKFDPDRFLPEEIAKRHPYTYMSFGGGPRNCVGLNYAMMSMKTMLATMLWKYTLKKNNIVPIKDMRLRYELLMKPAEPITLRIERRTRN